MKGKKFRKKTWFVVVTISLIVVVFTTLHISGLEPNKSPDYLLIGEIAIVGITAVFLFMYARDTRHLANDTRNQVDIVRQQFQESRTAWARLCVDSNRPVPEKKIRCFLKVINLRGIPFKAKVMLQMCVAGEKAELPGEPLYNGEEEWYIFESFGNLPAPAYKGLMEIAARYPNYTLDWLFPDNPDDGIHLPANLKDIRMRVSVTPVMIYGKSSKDRKVTCAGRYYLRKVTSEEIDSYGLSGSMSWYVWIPDVARKNYPPITWSGQPLSDEPVDIV